MITATLLALLPFGVLATTQTPSTPQRVAIANGLWQLHIYERGLREPSHWDYKGQSIHEPALSPDGKQVAYGVRTTEFADQKIWLADIAGKTRRQLTHKDGYDQGPSWSPDGRFILFVRQGVGLLAVDARGNEEKVLADGWSYAWSPDGHQLAVLRRNPALLRAEESFERGEFSADDVWILDNRLNPVRRVTREGWYCGIRWLDNKTLWAEQVGPEPFDGDGYSLRHYWIDLRSIRKSRMAIPATARWTTVSPDGNKVAYCEEPSHLYVFNLKTGRRISVDKDMYPSDMLWTGDGKWLYFNKMSSRPKNMYANTQQVWRADTKTWKVEQISEQPLSYAQFLFDERHSTVFFRTANSQLALSNSAHRVLTLGWTYNVQGITAWWGSKE